MPIIKSVARKGQNTPKSDFRGPKIPPEVRVRHETCSTICGTPVQAILDQKNLTGSAGGAREGRNMAHLGHSLQNVFKRTGWLPVFPYIALPDISFHIVIQPCPPRELRLG